MALFSPNVIFEVKYLIFSPITHVRMAERSKAPDSRVELFLTGVFWSTNVGVGSNPTSDKRFRMIRILEIARTLLPRIILRMISKAKKAV